MNSTGLSFTYQGAAPYAYPPGKATWFHWGTSLASFAFDTGNYAKPGSTAVTFSFQDGVHPTGFVATVWGGTIAHLDSLRIFTVGYAAGLFGSSAIRLQQQWVRPTGIATHTVIGTASIYNARQYVRPTGIVPHTTFGTLNTYNLWQRVYPTGFVGHAYGLALAYNKLRFVYTTGATSGAFGAQLVEHTDIRPAGIKLITRWGTAHPYNKTVMIYPTGRTWDTFGTALHVDNHKFTIPGLLHTKWGLPLAKNWRAFVYPAAAPMSAWGTAWVVNKIRNIYPTHPYTFQLLPNGTYGYAFNRIEQFGTPRAMNKRIAPAGIYATRFGTTWLAGTQIIEPFGVFDKLMGNKATVTSTIRDITPHWSDLGQFGLPSTSPKYIKPVGFNAGTMWLTTPRVGGTRATGVGLGMRTLFGVPYASFTPIYVRPPSIALVTKWGYPPWGVMHTFLQHIRPPLWVATKWDRPDWDYRPGLYVIAIEQDKMNGFVDESFGKPGLVDGDRYRWENTRLSKLEFNA